MPRYDPIATLSEYEFKEMKDIAGAHDDYIAGPQVQVSMILTDEHGEDVEAQLLVGLIPGRFEPLGFSCPLAGRPGERVEVKWTPELLNPMTPKAPEFLAGFVTRVTQALALRALGDDYICAKNQADAAYHVMVHDGFLEA